MSSMLEGLWKISRKLNSGVRYLASQLTDSFFRCSRIFTSIFASSIPEILKKWKRTSQILTLHTMSLSKWVVHSLCVKGYGME